MSNSPPLRIEIVGTLPAEGALRLDVVDVDWSAGGAVLSVPGPRRKPTRPYLEPFPTATSAFGARAVRGDGQVAPAAVVARSGLSVIALPEPPLAVAPRGDGAWVLYRDRLAHHAANGSEVRRLAVTGVLLAGSVDDGVWVADLESARHIAADGTVHGPYPWSAALASAPSGANLCTLKGTSAGVVTCLDPRGAQSTTPLAAPSKPIEQLLGGGAQGFVTAQGSTVRRLGKDGAVRELNVQAAGITAGGAGFVSTLDREGVELHVGAAPPRRLPLPGSVPPQGPFGVAAVEDARVLAAGLDQAAWYQGDQVQRAFALDDASYRSELFPLAWRVASIRPVALPDGSVIVSATGPAGMVLLKIAP
jgi:hypothetical protein